LEGVVNPEKNKKSSLRGEFPTAEEGETIRKEGERRGSNHEKK